MKRGRRKAAVWTLISLLVVAGLAGAVVVYRANLGLPTAERALRVGQWEEARTQLERFLWLHPEHGRGHLLMAEALVKDEALNGEQAIQQAVSHLDNIDDSSELAPVARMRQGRIEMLMLQRPGRAETQLRRALNLAPDQADANFLMWKLMDLTGRGNWSESYFWKVHDQAPLTQRAARLREWYMSQFFPGSANPTLNRMMGFLEDSQQADVLVERLRLMTFLVDEPDRAVNYAAWAWWLHDDGNPQLAMEVLDEGIEKLEHPEHNEFFVSVMVAILFDLGRFDDMSRWMELWPAPHTGYTYWRWQAVYLDEVQSKFAEALPLYQKAVVTWPGPAEWRVQNQMANCLSRMGQQDQARQVRIRAKQIEDLMEVDVHTGLREILGDLNNANNLQQIVDFYRKIDRLREADAWQAHVDALNE